MQVTAVRSNVRLSPSDRKTTKTVAITDLRSTETCAITTGVMNTKERKLSGVSGGTWHGVRKLGFELANQRSVECANQKLGKLCFLRKYLKDNFSKLLFLFHVSGYQCIVEEK